MISYGKLIMQVHGALLIGLFIALAIIQEDVWFKHLIEQRLQIVFYDIIKVPVRCRVKKLNLFSGEIIFDKLASYEPDGRWSFYSPISIVHFSWLSLLMRSQLEAHITFYDVITTSHIADNSFALMEPIKAFIDSPSVIPIVVNQCSFKKASLSIDDLKRSHTTLLIFSSDLIRLNSIFTGIISCSEGYIKKEAITFAQDITGSIALEIPLEKPTAFGLKIHACAQLPYLELATKRCVFLGTYKDGYGLCEFYHDDRSIIARGLNISYKHGLLSGDLHINGEITSLLAYSNYKKTSQDITGSLAFDAHADINAKDIDYAFTFLGQDIKHNAFKVQKLSIIGHGSSQAAQGSLELVECSSVSAGGTWRANILDKKLRSELVLTQLLNLPGAMSVEPGGACCSIDYNLQDINFDYTVRFKKEQRVTPQLLAGRANYKNNRVTLTGTLDAFNYSLVGTYDNLAILNASIKEPQQSGRPEREILKIFRTTNGTMLQGKLDYTLLKNLGLYMSDYALPDQDQSQGQGEVFFKAQRNGSIIKALVKLAKSNIRIPYMYNLVKDARAFIIADFDACSLVLKNAAINLHKGNINSACTTLLFSPQWKLEYAHVPLSAYGCLVSWHKDFFGLVNGSLTGIYNRKNTSTCKGQLVLDQSHLRSNLLSSQVQKDMVGSTLRSLKEYQSENAETEVQVDIGLGTQDYLSVKTPFLDAKARLALSLKGTIFNPKLSGLIELVQGHLMFPYKPLYITSGKIYLMPNQLDDPSIELTAKNKIKHYTIGLSVSGSLKQPKINFESSEGLQEEQIITLLFSGSQEGSLYLVMPNMLMHNLETMLFGPAESSSKLQRYVKTLLRPLKNVRLVPAEIGSNQTNSAGVLGAIEIDFNDRLRAKIQSNLPLPQETNIEVEYTLSDDVSIKALKDEHGGLSGEIEMRWKF